MLQQVINMLYSKQDIQSSKAAKESQILSSIKEEATNFANR